MIAKKTFAKTITVQIKSLYMKPESVKPEEFAYRNLPINYFQIPPSTPRQWSLSICSERITYSARIMSRINPLLRPFCHRFHQFYCWNYLLVGTDPLIMDYVFWFQRSRHANAALMWVGLHLEVSTSDSLLALPHVVWSIGFPKWPDTRLFHFATFILPWNVVSQRILNQQSEAIIKLQFSTLEIIIICFSRVDCSCFNISSRQSYAIQSYHI